MPRKTFVAGEILTAADVNTNLMDQAVMVFDDAAARDAAITSPIEGMVIYLEDTNAVQSYSGAAWVPAVNTASIVDANVTSAKLGAGTILQVVQTLKTDTFSTASDTFVTVTGTTATITPRSASSKILILGTMFVGSTSTTNNHSAFVKLVGGNTSAYLGNSAGNRVQALGSPGAFDGGNYGSQRANGFTSIAYLDSPATASAVSYNLELRRGGGGGAVIGSTGGDNDSAGFGRFPTTIILLEVAG
jgi:hypothetical protein